MQLLQIVVTAIMEIFADDDDAGKSTGPKK